MCAECYLYRMVLLVDRPHMYLLSQWMSAEGPEGGSQVDVFELIITCPTATWPHKSVRGCLQSQKGTEQSLFSI